MSECIKNTYGGDDHLNTSPAHIAIDAQFDQHSNCKHKYNSKIECKEMQDFNLSTIDEAQITTLKLVCNNTCNSINKNANESTDSTSNDNKSNTCDIASNLEVIDTE